MGVRLTPTHSDEYDYSELRQRLREAHVSGGINVDETTIDEIAAVARQVGVDPTPLRESLRVPADEEQRDRSLGGRNGPISDKDIVRLQDFTDELIRAIEAEVDVEAIREEIHESPAEEHLKERLSDRDRAYEEAHGYAMMIYELCQKAQEWQFSLKIG